MNDTPVSLLERLRRHPDSAAWQRLVEIYTPLIRTWIARQGVPATDVDDVSQEVLAVVVKELPRFEHNAHKGAFRTWLRRIAVNRLRTYWREQAGPLAQNTVALEASLQELEDSDSALSRLWDREHDDWIVARLLQAIEPEFEPLTWQAFRLIVLEEKPTAEVAEQLGLSLNAVRIAKSRVLSRFRQEAAGLVD